MQIQEAIGKLGHRENLTRLEARAVMRELLSGSVPDAEITSLLTALRDKGETGDEIVGFAEVMRDRARELLESGGVRLGALVGDQALVDTCGTGGDAMGTVNVSTGAAIVAAAAGVRVAKHGNRSISSRCGSADVLEALGVAVDVPPSTIPACLDAVSIVFLYAPSLHAATRHVMNARRALGTKTIFNLLGPLTNPLGATAQLAGVWDRARTETLALALAEVGTRRAFVVAARDGMDEISTSGPTQLSEYHNSRLHTREITPEDFGLSRSPAEELAGGDVETNARLLREVLEGKKGACRDVVLANASAALVVSGRASDFPAGVALAAEAIDSGAALDTLRKLGEFTRKRRRPG